jgi:hypothetical protein
MAALEERIRELEEELKRTPYNKATQRHIGRLRARIARLKEEKKKRTKAGVRSHGIRKSGDATVVLIGFPSVGKSSLLNRLTSASAKVAGYPFTTLEVIPGVMEYRGARIQILDVPGLINGASAGRGRGREVLSIVRSADLVVLLIDVFNLQQLEVLKQELHSAGIRLDQEPPRVKIKPRPKGGISISSTAKLTRIDEETIKDVLAEFRIYNAEVAIREDITLERLLDAVVGNRVYLPSLVVLNKIDLVREEYITEIKTKLDCIPVSAKTGANLEALKEAIYSRLEFIRVFTKQPGEKPDLREPLILVKGSTIADLCSRLHGDFKENFRYARVWGSSARHGGQRVGLRHVLADNDIVTIATRR